MGSTEAVQAGMQKYKRVLIASVFLNVVLVVSGSVYVYKTRSKITAWYKQFVKVEASLQKTKPRHNGYYYIRLNALQVSREKQDVAKKVIIFAGDSLTDYFEWSEYFGEMKDVVVVNRGIAGDNIDGLMERFDSTFLPEKNVKRVFLMIGVNDMSRNGFQVDEFTKKYAVLVERLAQYIPRGHICVQSIIPTRVEYKSNETIREINRKLRTYADTQGYCFIDLHSKFVDETGQLGQKYSEDGIHLTAEGYKVWLETIEPYVVR